MDDDQFTDEKPDYSRILNIIEDCEDGEKLTIIFQNALRKKVEIVANAARSKLKRLIPKYKLDSFENQFWNTFSAYEDLLLDNAKPVTILNETRLEALANGEVAALTNWINAGHQSWALHALVSMKQGLYTAEKLSLNFPDLFDGGTLETARKRLKHAHAE